MSKDVVDERRAHVRFTLNAECAFKFETGQIVGGYINDISVGGVFMLLDHSPDPSLWMDKEGEIFIYCDCDGQRVTIEAVCRVVRAKDNGIGIFFQAMDKDSKKNLSAVMGRLRNLLNGCT